MMNVQSCGDVFNAELLHGLLLTGLHAVTIPLGAPEYRNLERLQATWKKLEVERGLRCNSEVCMEQFTEISSHTDVCLVVST